MNRRTSIVLLTFLAILVATSCVSQGLREELEATEQEEESVSPAGDEDGASDLDEDEETTEDEASGTGSETPVDDDGEDETAGCAVAPEGPDPRVVPSTLVPVVDEHGHLLINVRTCEAVDPLAPYGEFHSAYYQCGGFGFEIHTGVTTVLGDPPPTEAHTLVDGTFLFNTGSPPPDPFPSGETCIYASWDTAEAPVNSGEGEVDYAGTPTSDENIPERAKDLSDTGGA